MMISTWARAEGKALVIIDMQDFFAQRQGTHKQFANPQVLAKIMERQKRMIDIAKSRNIPILIVEYGSDTHHPIGRTNSELRNQIGRYRNLKRIVKQRDGLFDSDPVASHAHRILRRWGVNELIIIGANGGACVERTIQGALQTGYKVKAYSDAIADFNYDRFQYPYIYRGGREQAFGVDLRPNLKVAVPSVKAMRINNPEYATADEKKVPKSDVLTGSVNFPLTEPGAYGEVDVDGAR